jgi:hypothetical protein
MIWGILYLLLLVATAIIVFTYGGRDERIATTTMALGSLLTVAMLVLTATRFESFNFLVATVDVAVLVALYAQSLLSARYWTLCLPAFQLIATSTHIMKIVAPEIIPRVYIVGQGFWAYPTLLVILAATVWNYAKQRQSAKIRKERHGS